MSNLHVNLDEANKHTPKGFDSAVNNTFLTKDEQGLSTYKERMMLDKAINFVDGTLAPPTTANGDIYVLIGSGTVEAGWGGANFDDWVIFQNGIAVTITPLAGYLCYDTTASQWKEYDGSDWVTADANSTNLSEGTSTTTTVDVDSDTGTNATLQPASTLRAGVMSKAKFDEVEANNAKVTNATHTGEVIGSGALTVDPTAISNKTALGSLSGTEEFLINDGGVLKKVLASNVGGGGDNIYTADGTMSYGVETTRTVNLANKSVTFTQGNLILKRTSGEANLNVESTTSTALTFMSLYNDAGQLGGLIGGGSTFNSASQLLLGNSVTLRTTTSGDNLNFTSSNLSGRINFIFGSNNIDANVYTKMTTVGVLIGVSVGADSIDARLQVKGTGATSGTSALIIENSSAQKIIEARDDNAISFYGGVPTQQATTGVAAAAIINGSGTNALQDDTFDGYTVAQVVTALRAIGILA